MSLRLKEIVSRGLQRLGWTLERYPPRRPPADALPELLRRVIQVYDVDLVIDVGANRGQYASLIRSLGYSGRIVSFEPATASYQVASELAVSDRRWEVHQLALGAASGEASLNVAEDDSVSSFLSPTRWYLSRYPQGGTIRTETVSVQRLNLVWGSLVRPAERVLLKSDTQGHDLSVIAGAAGMLDKVVAVQLELSVQHIYNNMIDYLEAIATVQDLGLVPAGFFLVDADESLRAVEFDGIFVKSRGLRSGR
jgi:FkbM family methyltransferase